MASTHSGIKNMAMENECQSHKFTLFLAEKELFVPESLEEDTQVPHVILV